MGERKVRLRDFEVMVQQEGHDRIGQLLPRLPSRVGDAARIGRRRVACGVAVSGMAKPQPIQKPPYRLG